MKALLLSGFAAALVCVGSPAVAQSVVGQLFARADRAYNLHGYAAFGWEKRGQLRNGAEESFTVTLSGGAEYSLIGVCDADCENFDLYVTDEKGVAVTQDVEDDDFPVVYIKRAGTFRVRAVMTKCTDAPCAFGVKAYKM